MTIIMNDPAEFDIWAKVNKDSSKLVASWLADQLSIGMMDAYKVISPEVKSGKYVQIFTGYGWNNLPRLLDNLPDFVVAGSAVFAEEGCSPDDPVVFCDLHKLYHNPGSCPICSGNYIHEGHRN